MTAPTMQFTSPPVTGAEVYSEQWLGTVLDGARCVLLVRRLQGPDWARCPWPAWTLTYSDTDPLGSEAATAAEVVLTVSAVVCLDALTAFARWLGLGADAAALALVTAPESEPTPSEREAIAAWEQEGEPGSAPLLSVRANTTDWMKP